MAKEICNCSELMQISCAICLSNILAQTDRSIQFWLGFCRWPYLPSVLPPYIKSIYCSITCKTCQYQTLIFSPGIWLSFIVRAGGCHLYYGTKLLENGKSSTRCSNCSKMRKMQILYTESSHVVHPTRAGLRYLTMAFQHLVNLEF